MGFDRYKFVVQCVIGEQRGEGVKMGCRCFWDSDTDNYAQDVFMNVRSNDSNSCLSTGDCKFFSVIDIIISFVRLSQWFSNFSAR